MLEFMFLFRLIIAAVFGVALTAATSPLAWAETESGSSSTKTSTDSKSPTETKSSTAETNDSSGDDKSETNTGDRKTSSIPNTSPASGGGSSDSKSMRDFAKSLTLDSDQAKFAISQGKAASMPLLLAYLGNKFPGEVLDVKLHDAGQSYVYEVRYLSNAVFLRTVFLDALTLQQK